MGRRPPASASLAAPGLTRLLSTHARTRQEWERQIFAEFLHAARGADVIVCSTVAYGAHECAETLGVPLVTSHLVPLIPTRTASNLFFGGAWPLGPLNRTSPLLMEQTSWQSLRAAVNAWRVAALGLPRLGTLDTTFARARASGQPILSAYSPSLVPKPPDWGTRAVVTGYWFLDTPPASTPPPGLVRFLEQGPPPLCGGCGSMSEERPEQTVRIRRTVVALAGQRAVVISGWASLSPRQPDERIYWAEAVVYHGGAGTTGTVCGRGWPHEPHRDAPLHPRGLTVPR